MKCNWKTLGDEVNALIADYIVRLGGHREAPAGGELSPLPAATIDALMQWLNDDDDDAPIPVGLPGAGQRYAVLTDEDRDVIDWGINHVHELLETGVQVVQ